MTKERCARCSRWATDLIYCAKHYDEYLSEWACRCGYIEIGSYCRKCGARPPY